MTDRGDRGVTTILNGHRPEGRRLAGASQGASSNLADLLERVLDKGIIIAGDITLCLGEIELLQIKVRLLIASVDRARDMGIDWWQHDPALSSAANVGAPEKDQLLQRLERKEKMLAPLVEERAKHPAAANAVISGAAAHDQGHDTHDNALADVHVDALNGSRLNGSRLNGSRLNGSQAEAP